MLDNTKLRDMICKSVDETDEARTIQDRIGARLDSLTPRQLIPEVIEEYKNLLFERADTPAPTLEDTGC